MSGDLTRSAAEGCHLDAFASLLGAAQAALPRFQVAYRRPLFAELAAEPDPGVDGVQVLAEHFLGAPRQDLIELDIVARRFPCTLRGTSLSLGSPERPDRTLLKAVKKLARRIGATRYSELLGLTRAGGVELGQAAPVPRTRASAERIAAHTCEVQDALELPLLLENVAAPVSMPGEMREAEFMALVVETSGCDLLLDLHALHADGENHGFAAEDLVGWLPLERVREVHLSGATPAGRRRRVRDSHDASAPAAVMGLLARVARRAHLLEAVTLERDERVPALRVLRKELDSARAAVREAMVLHAFAS
jgi:uncharacterized protein (UPF0276 family)